MFLKCGIFLWIFCNFRCWAINISVLVDEVKLNSNLIKQQLGVKIMENNLTDLITPSVDAINILFCKCSTKSLMANFLENKAIIFAITNNKVLIASIKKILPSQLWFIPIDKYVYISSKNFFNQQLLSGITQLVISKSEWIILESKDELSFCLSLDNVTSVYKINLRCFDTTEMIGSQIKMDEFMNQSMKGKTYKIILVTQSTDDIKQFLQAAIKNDLMTSLYEWIIVTKRCDLWTPQRSMNLTVICDLQHQNISEMNVVSDILTRTQNYLKNSNIDKEAFQSNSTVLFQLGKCNGQYSFYLSKRLDQNIWSPITNSSCKPAVDNTAVRICVSLEEPFIYNVTSTDSVTQNLGGYIIEILKYIESRQPVSFQVYLQKNYSACVNDIENQKSLISIGRDSSVNYNLKGFYHSETIYWESIQVFAHKPENDSKLWNILRPLQYQVWILCIISCLISAFTGVMFSKYSPLSAWNLGLEISIIDEVSFAENLWSYVGASLMQGQDFYPYSISSRIVLAIWWLFVLIMSNVYSADLTSFLTISSGMRKSASLDELLINPQYKLFTVENSRAHSLLKNSNDTKYKNIVNKILLEQSLQNCINKVLNNTNAACMGEASPLIKSATRNCSAVYMVDEYLEWQPLSFMFTANTSMKILLNNEIKMLIEIGLLDKWITQYWLTGDAFDLPCNSDLQSSILGLADIGGAFILTAILFGLGAIFLVIEFTMYYVTKKKVVKSFDNSNNDR